MMMCLEKIRILKAFCFFLILLSITYLFFLMLNVPNSKLTMPMPIGIDPAEDNWRSEEGEEEFDQGPKKSLTKKEFWAPEENEDKGDRGLNILHPECYRYQKVTATNKCCLMYNYKAQDLFKCAEAIENSGRGVAQKRLSIVIIGDSRTRQIFNSLAYLLRNTNITYTYQEKSRIISGPIKDLVSRMFETTFHTNIHLHGVEIPLEITYYWDPYLEKFLPNLLRQWLTHPQTSPHLLEIGAGTHFLVWKRKEAFSKFTKMLEDRLPLLRQLADTTCVIFSMLDHVLVRYHKSFKKHELTDERIDHINTILSSFLHEVPNKIIYWNNSLPLSDQYATECYKNKLQTKDSRWKCNDPTHLGYVIIHQLRNMMLNSFCNKNLQLGTYYC